MSCGIETPNRSMTCAYKTTKASNARWLWDASADGSGRMEPFAADCQHLLETAYLTGSNVRVCYYLLYTFAITYYIYTGIYIYIYVGVQGLVYYCRPQMIITINNPLLPLRMDLFPTPKRVK